MPTCDKSHIVSKRERESDFCGRAQTCFAPFCSAAIGTLSSSSSRVFVALDSTRCDRRDRRAKDDQMSERAQVRPLVVESIDQLRATTSDTTRRRVSLSINLLVQSALARSLASNCISLCSLATMADCNYVRALDDDASDAFGAAAKLDQKQRRAAWRRSHRLRLRRQTLRLRLQRFVYGAGRTGRASN